MPSDPPALINADPTRAFTLPSRYFTDPDIFALERTRIFHRAWQYACHEHSLPEQGDWRVVDLADQSVLVVRCEDGELRAFHNVCQHRGHRLAEGEGCSKAFVCPYHGWRYGLDGGLTYARESDRIADFRHADFGLRPVRIERMAGLVMFNLDPDAPSFESLHPGLEAEIRERIPDLDRLTEPERVTGFANSTLECNWKVLVDNCVECYHCTPAHRDFVDLIDMDSYRITMHARHSSHVASAARTDSAAYAFDGQGGAGEFAFWHVWPNMTFGRFPGEPNFGVFVADPVSVERTRSRGDRFRLPGPESDEVRRRREYIDNVLWPEDRAICESVQRGMHSLGYERGRFIGAAEPDGHCENVSHLFQRLTLEALGGA